VRDAVGQIPESVRLVLGLGGSAEVLAPGEVRAAVHAAALAGLARHPTG